MANVTGTTGNDYIHPDDGTATPSGYTNDTQYASQGDDYIDASQGGTDYIVGGDGNDYIYMGSTLTNADIIDGGDGLGDVLALAGNYVGTSIRNPRGGSFFIDTSITFTESSLSGIERIDLSDASGDKYKLTLSANADFGSSLTIDASGLTTAPLTLDASAFNQFLTVDIGAGTVALTGGASDNVFAFTYAPTASQVVHGNSAASENIVQFENYAAQSFTLDAAHFSNIDTFDFQNGSYTVMATADLLAAGQVGTVFGYYASSLSFSADPASLAAFNFTGSAGDDTLRGGSGNDTIQAYSGNASLSGGNGDDFISAIVSSADTVRIDGGGGSDMVSIELVSDDPVTFDAASFASVENLTLTYSVSSPGHQFSATFADGSVAAGQTLNVHLQYDLSPIDLNAQAVTGGSFVFTILSYPDTGNVVEAGGGNDTFIVVDPNGTSGSPNQWDGGSGINTLDYSSDTHSLAIDAVAGTATGSGSVPDDIANFQIFKFGMGTVSFNGLGNAETIYMDKSGTATVHGNGGNDVVYLGATLDPLDFIDGGANTDTVILDGDYSAGLIFNSYTLTSIETLKLQHLAGEPTYSYTLTTADGTVAAGATLTIDASQLPVGGTLAFDGSAESDGHFNIMGGADADTMKGGALADTLSGGGGANSLTGGAGNDTYVVDNAADRVIEAANGGTDTVYSSTSFALGAGQSVEYLGTTSQAGTAALALTGNALSQTVNGNAGANRLDGGGGGDTLSGHKGNDIYLVRSSGDQVIEANGEGTDTVYATVSYTLGSGQSIDTLATASQAGTGALNLTGNNNANHIIGNNGNNIISGSGGVDLLFGYGGNDTIIGGAASDTIDTGNGRDVVRFNQLSDSTGVNRDVIYTMNLGATDKFDFPVVPTSIHAEVTTGSLSTATFDHDLAAAIHTSSQLGAHQAVLFDPNGGDLNVAGHLFLIVDVNGQAGYQAGADYVVELVNPTGTLTTDDFI